MCERSRISDSMVTAVKRSNDDTCSAVTCATPRAHAVHSTVHCSRITSSSCTLCTVKHANVMRHTRRLHRRLFGSLYLPRMIDTTSGVFCKGSAQGYISAVHFQRCSNFSIFFTITVTALQRMLWLCEQELNSIDMVIDVKKSCCMRVTRQDKSCSSISTTDGRQLSWVNEIRISVQQLYVL